MAVVARSVSMLQERPNRAQSWDRASKCMGGRQEEIWRKVKMKWRSPKVHYRACITVPWIKRFDLTIDLDNCIGQSEQVQFGTLAKPEHNRAT